MSSTRSRVIALLADGAFHSGTEMGQALGVTRAAINKAIKSLVEMGLEIHRVSGRGYRLLEPSPPLAQQKIIKYMAENSAVAQLHVLDEVDSTSQFLLQLARESNIDRHVCLAEIQNCGRGRRGRQWLTTPYTNLTMSLAWNYAAGPAVLAGLSLAAGVAVVEALNELGIEGIGLKWPNDIMWQHKKLGGILVDIQGEADGPSLVVLGVGINVKLYQRSAECIDQQWADLFELSGNAQDRNRLAALLIEKLFAVLHGFDHKGFENYRQNWQQLHVFNDQAVRLLSADSEYHGTVEGVDAAGALVFRHTSGERQLFHSGEISLRSM